MADIFLPKIGELFYFNPKLYSLDGAEYLKPTQGEMLIAGPLTGQVIMSFGMYWGVDIAFYKISHPIFYLTFDGYASGTDIAGCIRAEDTFSEPEHPAGIYCSCTNRSTTPSFIGIGPAGTTIEVCNICKKEAL